MPHGDMTRNAGEAWRGPARGEQEGGGSMRMIGMADGRWRWGLGIGKPDAPGPPISSVVRGLVWARDGREWIVIGSHASMNREYGIWEYGTTATMGMGIQYTYGERSADRMQESNNHHARPDLWGRIRRGRAVITRWSREAANAQTPLHRRFLRGKNYTASALGHLMFGGLRLCLGLDLG